MNEGKIENRYIRKERQSHGMGGASRMVNLISLAQNMVADILDETLILEVTLFELAAGTPLLWEGQRGGELKWADERP